MQLARNQKGIAHLAIFIIFAVSAIGSVGYMSWRAWQANKQKNHTQVYSSQEKNDQTTTSSVDSMSDWIEFSSSLGGFSLRYPSTWVQPTNKELCSEGLFDRSLYIGPDSKSVLRCGTEYFGQVWIGSVKGNKSADYELGADYKNVTKKEVTVDGVSGQRISGIAAPRSDEDVFTPIKGTLEVRYIFYVDGVTYAASYTQVPEGNSPAADVLKEFDSIIKKTLQFSTQN